MTHPRANRGVTSFAPSCAKGRVRGSERPGPGPATCEGRAGDPSARSVLGAGAPCPPSTGTPRARRSGPRRGSSGDCGGFPGPWGPEPAPRPAGGWRGRGGSRAPLRVSERSDWALPSSEAFGFQGDWGRGRSVEPDGAASPSSAAPAPLASGVVSPRAEEATRGWAAALLRIWPLAPARTLPWTLAPRRPPPCSWPHRGARALRGPVCRASLCHPHPLLPPPARPGLELPGESPVTDSSVPASLGPMSALRGCFF